MVGFAVTRLLPEPAGRSLEDVAEDTVHSALPRMVRVVPATDLTNPELKTA